mmetsp:Transcript_55608/g.162563  ORF Transcript_55608/g.162563 Transcript_55608/m.162563 type:complete len:283 (-) Transcript_55608:46-894(-)
MVDRFRFVLPAGEKKSCRLPWADDRDGSASRLGSLSWNVVVLPPAEGGGTELTVDMTVSAELSAKEPEAAQGPLLLQKTSRGRTFQGRFDPAKSRLGRQRDGAAGAGDEGGAGVESIVFEVSNEFSWWTEKDVEFVVVRDRPPGFPLARVPPLPPMRLPSPIPRGYRAGAEAPSFGSHADAAPQLHATSPSAGPSDCEIRRLVLHLDGWLAAAEEQRPHHGDNAWLEQLLSHVGDLRGFCKELPSGTSGEAEQSHGGPGGEPEPPSGLPADARAPPAPPVAA